MEKKAIQFNDNIYKDLAEMIEIWHHEHPDDQTEVPVAD